MASDDRIVGLVEWLLESIPEEAYLALTELIVSGLNAYIVAGIYKTCRSNSAVLSALKDAPSLTVGSELTHAVESTENGILPYAAIRGKVDKFHGHVIPPSRNGVSSVIKITQNQEIRSKYSWTGNRYTYNGRTFVTEEFHPFSLRPISEHPISINFQSNENSSGNATKADNQQAHGSGSPNISPILVIKDMTIPDTTNLLQTFPTYFEKNDRKDFRFPRILEYIFGLYTVTGVKKTDQLLPIDEVITAIGRVTHSEDGQYTLTAPSVPYSLYMLTRIPIEDIVEDYSARNVVGLFLIFIFTSGGLFLLYDAMKRFKSIYDAMYPPEIDLGSTNFCDIYDDTQNESSSSNSLCVVCHERPRNVVLMNCKHFCTCESCTGRLLGPRCPVCRKKVENCLRVFVP